MFLARLSPQRGVGEKSGGLFVVISYHNKYVHTNTGTLGILSFHNTYNVISMVGPPLALIVPQIDRTAQIIPETQ